MNSLNNTFSNFEQHLFRTLPRILSQLDRDPHSPTFGSFDRYFWHYKIRDFSSIILQQGMLVLDFLYDFSHDQNRLHGHPLARKWADASLRFWARRQLSFGSFEEYYPFEEGFPPTAFSLYAVALLLRQRQYPTVEPAVATAIQKAADWLVAHRESHALNQEAAGLTALALLQDMPGMNIDRRALAHRLDLFFAAQSPEGWFPEYGGADVGYLSVTLDCLWDYFETTGDERAKTAMTRATRFIAGMIPLAGGTPVMTNSRNTDYIVPYGLVRFAGTDPLAKRVVERLLTSLDGSNHFLYSTDDRYLCHYVYQSCFRSLPYLGKMTREHCQLPCEDGMISFLADAGIFIQHIPGLSSLYVAGQKGGIIYSYSPHGLADVDFGWREHRPDGGVALTQWQDAEAEVIYDNRDGLVSLHVRRAVTMHKWLVPTVLRHLVLRVVSFIGGNRLIPLLKKALIFKAMRSGIWFDRYISVDHDAVVIKDTFQGGHIGSFRPEPAPCYSLRHVASAANFSIEELLLTPLQPRKLQHHGDRVTCLRKLVRRQNSSGGDLL